MTKEPCGCPPLTDRGAHLTDDLISSIDWLEFTVWGLTVDEVKRVLRGYLADDFFELSHGALGYERQAVGLANSRIFWLPRRQRQAKREGPEVHVTLPGRWCAALDQAQMRGLLAYVRAHGQPSRVDLAVDDHTRRVVPSELREALLRKEVVTHMLAREYHEDFRTGGSNFQLGSRSSRQMLRVYDKTAQSDGEIDAIRWEIQTRDEAAASLLDALVLGNWGKVWAARLVQIVDFRDRDADSDLSRCPRLSWFAALVGAAKKATVYAKKPVITLEHVDKWIKKQVMPMLSAWFAARGGDVDDLFWNMGSGRARWREKHRLVVAQGLVT